MCTLRHSRQYHQPVPLTPWFAWHPVRLSGYPKRLVWLRTIRRRYCIICGWLYQE